MYIYVVISLFYAISMSSNTIAAESSLDRLSCALGGKTVLPHLTHALPAMLQNPEWKARHAGLMAISACGEGCHKAMENMLDNILDAVLPFLQDPVSRKSLFFAKSVVLFGEFLLAMDSQFPFLLEYF